LNFLLGFGAEDEVLKQVHVFQGRGMPGTEPKKSGIGLQKISISGKYGKWMVARKAGREFTMFVLAPTH
jgi:hypothetical protein